MTKNETIYFSFSALAISFVIVSIVLLSTIERLEIQIKELQSAVDMLIVKMQIVDYEPFRDPQFKPGR